MRKLNLFFIIFVPLFLNAQINESFTDGDFTNQPEWVGHTSNFTVNTQFQLQSNATATSTSWLFTPSGAIDNAVWECSFRINYTTSSSNYASFYIVSDVADLTKGCNGYFVQVGGTNDEVSLFQQQGTVKTKIIDGTDKRTDGNPVQIRIKVERDKNGNFALYSKLSTESEFKQEGSTQNSVVKTSKYVGLLFANTSTTGQSYIFDDILVTGNIAADTTAPEVISVAIVLPDKMEIEFSEAVNISNASFIVSNDVNSPKQVFQENDRKITLSFNSNFEKGKVYTIDIKDVKDISGNNLIPINIKTGLTEPAAEGDLIWNELMFNAPVGGQEYVEIMNVSGKLIQMSDIVFATRKSDGTLNTTVSVDSVDFLAPNEILALTEYPDSVIAYHQPVSTTKILKTKNWYNLNNESATLVLCNSAKDTIYDEISYSSSWHHVLISEKKGVALERINPNNPTQDATNWHSAASEVRYGTPGYENSQYRVTGENNTEKVVWLESEYFSPDNDGSNDVCTIRYNTDYAGFVANITVFNPSGVLVAKLAENVLLSANGSINWDGKTVRGTNAETGIYLLYFEMFHPDTGQKKIIKLPLVVSAR